MLQYSLSFLKNTDYIHKGFLVAHPLLGERVGEELEGLPFAVISMLLADYLKGKETGKRASSRASRYTVEAAGGRG